MVAEWSNKNYPSFPVPAGNRTKESAPQLTQRHRLFAYREDLRTIIAPMALDGKEPTGSMGNDTPLAVLSHKQHFAV